MSGPAKPRLPRTFWLLWTGYLANRLGLLSPAFLALYLSGEHVMSTSEAGLAIAAWGTGTVAGGLVGGLIADRIGPRRTMWTSQLLASAASLTLILAREPVLVIVLALVSGTLIGFPRSAAFGMTAHLIAPALRLRAYGQLYWANSLGNSVSALLSGFLLHLWPPSLFLPSAVSAATYALVALMLPDVRSATPPPAAATAPRPVSAPAPRLVRQAPPSDPPARHPRRRWVRGVLADVFEPFASRCVGPFLLLTFVLSCVYMQRQSAMPLDMHNNGLSYTQLGALLSFSAILIVVIQPFSAHFTSRLRPGRAMALSAALIGTGLGLNAVVNSAAGYVVGVTIWTFGDIIMVPLAAAFMADHAQPERTSTYQGAYAFVFTLGLAVGAPAGQVLLTVIGPTLLWSGALVLGLCVAVGQLYLAKRCNWMGTKVRLRQEQIAAQQARSEGTGPAGSEQFEPPVHPEQPDRMSRSESRDRPESRDRRPDRPESQDRNLDRPESRDRRPDRPEGRDRNLDRPDRPDGRDRRADRAERPDRPQHSDRPDRPGHDRTTGSLGHINAPREPHPDDGRPERRERDQTG